LRIFTSSTKPQAAAMFIGSLCPGVSSVLYLAGLAPYGMDIVPFAMVITGLMCALGLFRYRFLNVVPVAVNAVFRDTRGGVVGKMIVLVDTTDRVRLLEEMRILAVTDGLTGLYNRRHFMEHARIEMERARRTGKPVSAVAVDLDHFKSINDTYGHAAGDVVLKSSSAVWAGLLRPIDILGRCGGEEFGILLPETAIETAVPAASPLFLPLFPSRTITP